MSSDQPDPYVVLGVSPGASIEELKRARRTLAKKWHPDRSWSDTGADTIDRNQQMKLINAAYLELSRRDPVQEAARARAEQTERERKARERAAEREATQAARESAAADAAARERSERMARERAERERREHMERERTERERAEHERTRRERDRADRDARQPSRFASEALSERTTFHPVGLVFPSGREGVTIRICVDEDDDDNVIFLARGSRLLLFHSPESMAAFLTTDFNHDLARLPAWRDIRMSMAASPPVPAEDDYADFEFILQSLLAPPTAWVPQPFLVCRDMVLEIGKAFGDRRLLEAVGPGSPIDRLDDALRAVDRPAPDRRARRQLRRLDGGELGTHWRLAASRLRSIAHWHAES